MTGLHAELLRETLAKHGGAQVTCVGDSMAPTFARGDRLRLVPCSSPRPGDVVLLATRSGLVSHRVQARLGAILVHAGDATPRLSGLVRAHAVVGRIVSPRRPPTLPARATAAVRAVWRLLTR